MLKRMCGLCCPMLLVLALTGCAAASESPRPAETAAPAPASQGAQATLLISAGGNAAITVSGTTVQGGAFFIGGDRDTLFFPLVEVAQALGWAAESPKEADGEMSEICFSREGMQVTTIRYPMQSEQYTGILTGIQAFKGEYPADDFGREAFPVIDGVLYAPEELIDRALQEIDTQHDGKSRIIIEAKA